MPHSQSFDALVLKTYDVGEADRLCILFTREQGRMMARASGARRTKSRLGGSLLPFQRLTVELKESGSAWIVCGVSGAKTEDRITDIDGFMALEEGIELLLRLVQHEGELTDVFDATVAFVDACRDGIAHASLGYSFALLDHLGLLPAEEDIDNIAELGPVEHAYVRSSCAGTFSAPDAICNTGRLFTLRSRLLEANLSSPLKVGMVSEAMR